MKRDRERSATQQEAPPHDQTSLWEPVSAGLDKWALYGCMHGSLHTAPQGPGQPYKHIKRGKGLSEGMPFITNPPCSTYTRVHAHTHTHTHTHACMRTHARMHTHKHTHAGTHANTHARTHARTHAGTHITHTCMHVHTLARTRTRLRVHRQTHCFKGAW